MLNRNRGILIVYTAGAGYALRNLEQSDRCSFISMLEWSTIIEFQRIKMSSEDGQENSVHPRL